MPKSIIKRNGKRVKFDPLKIRNAILKANVRIATERFSEDDLDRLTQQVVEELEGMKSTPTVEQTQDVVEEKLIAADYAKTAKAYILYRAQHQRLREMDDELVKIYSALTFVPAEDVEAYQAANDTFVILEGEAPAQYKTVSMENGRPVYSATRFNVADTVSDATAELVTGSTWGDYQINVTDGETIHLRNTREDEGFDIGADIQGIILETDSGLKVGMEHLQSIWVQPYEVSFNVSKDNTHNTHITGFDNLPELDKLVGETVTKITYIMPDAAYVYEFEGIYIKPLYENRVSASVSEGYDALTLSIDDFSDFENGKLTVSYTLGSGRSREVVSLLETDLANGAADYTLDVSAIAGLDAGGVYSAILSSDTYADVTVGLPVSSGQKAALEALLATANEKLAAEPENATLQEHIGEAEELLAGANATSLEAGSLISELTQLTSDGEDGSSKH